MAKTPEQINNRIAGRDNLGSPGFYQTRMAIIVSKSGALLSLLVSAVSNVYKHERKKKNQIPKDKVLHHEGNYYFISYIT